MKKRYRRPLLIVLALIFLFESWLWEAAGKLVAYVLHHLPLEELAKRFSAIIERLTPVQTVFLFIIPVLVLLPLKFIALWLLAQGYIFTGVSTVIFAKVAGFGVSSFLFSRCKPKLLQVRLVKWAYDHCIVWRDKAHQLVKPYTRYIRQYLRVLKPKGSPAIISRLRARMHKVRRKTARE